MILPLLGALELHLPCWLGVGLAPGMWEKSQGTSLSPGFL